MSESTVKTASRTKVAVIGSGNIGTDLMIKVLRLSATLEMGAMVGIDPTSDGLARAERLGVPTTHKGVEGLIAMDCFEDIAIVFDATSAGAHQHNAATLAPYGKRMIDLTPAAIGPYVVPPVNLDAHLDADNLNMVTCGGQATVPVVAAPYNMTLGGGLELCFGCDAVQAAAETYAGLVEVGVGLIPGGAGTLNMLWRGMESIPEGVEFDTYAFVTQTFKNIALAKVATSAEEAKANGFFRATDGVSFDRARQLHEAKQRVIGLADAGYHPPIPRAYKLPGESGIATLQMLVNTLVAGKYASEHDGKIAMKLAEVLCGGAGGGAGPVTEDRMLELEREAFLSLCGEPKSHERMQYMLMNNKPLRN